MSSREPNTTWDHDQQHDICDFQTPEVTEINSLRGKYTSILQVAIVYGVANTRSYCLISEPK